MASWRFRVQSSPTPPSPKGRTPDACSWWTLLPSHSLPTGLHTATSASTRRVIALYLPFEGAGAVSDWKLEFPELMRLFNYNTITDVIVHLSYTALDDTSYRRAVEDNIRGSLETLASSGGLQRFTSLKHEFSTAYSRILRSTETSSRIIEFEITQHHFPYFLAGENLSMSGATVYRLPKGVNAVPAIEHRLSLTINAITSDTLDSARSLSVRSNVVEFSPEEVEDIWILLRYEF